MNFEKLPIETIYNIKLPIETIYNILEYCDLKTIIVLRQTNKYFNNSIAVKELLRKARQIEQENKKLKEEINLLKRKRYLDLIEIVNRNSRR